MEYNSKRYLLGEIVKIKYGKNQKKVQDNINGQYPIYGTGGLMGMSIEYLYDKPSVLIGRKGSISKVKYVDHPFWNVDTLFYTEVNEKIVLPKFLYYIMSLIDFNYYNEGTTIPSLRTETLNRIEFLIPEMDIQRIIVSILDKLDSKIKINNKINENLQSISELLFKHWFIDFEFPNEEGLPYKSSGGEMIDSELGMIPKGWEIKTLDYLCNITSSKRIFMNEYVQEGIPFYRSKEIIEKSKGKAISTELYISLDKYNEIKEKFSVPEKGEILLTSVGTLGIPYKIEGEKFYFKDGNLTWFKDFIAKEYSNYIYLWILSDEGKKMLNSITIGSTQKALTIASLKKLKLVVPNDFILNKFELLVEEMLDKICMNNKENNSLASIRDTLLPKLMSGEINLTNLEINE